MKATKLLDSKVFFDLLSIREIASLYSNVSKNFKRDQTS